MSKVSVVRSAVRGGMVGLLVPTIVLVIFSVLAKSGIALGVHLITALPIIAAALLELPGVIIGRTLGLPIETGGAAFIVCDLNAFGYVLVLVVWSFVGSLIGAVFGWVRSIARIKPATA